ncbi:MAG: response regulator transcription factor [Syntrophomonadaceae bacterium]|nr:response regulator transcription factor [Syntrophomonadaceae bacterium]
MFNVLILEDEPYTLNYLEAIIGEHPLVNKVYGTGDGRQAVQLARKKQPTIAFLDIVLSSEDPFNGLEVAHYISEINPATKIVFISGYGRYVLDSFAVHPYDYILKPVNKDRIFNTLTKLANQVLPKDKYFHKIIISCKDETVFLDSAEIFFFEKEGKKTVAHTSQGVYTFSRSLNDLNDSLPEEFLRTHKSFIVNVNNIKALQVTGSRSWEVVFEDYDKRALLSRYKYREVQEGLCFLGRII